MSIGYKLKEARKLKGLSLDQLSDITSISKSYIWSLENKKDSNPSIFKINKLACALDVTYDYLTNDNYLHDDMLKELLWRKFNFLGETDKYRLLKIIDILAGAPNNDEQLD